MENLISRSGSFPVNGSGAQNGKRELIPWQKWNKIAIALSHNFVRMSQAAEQKCNPLYTYIFIPLMTSLGNEMYPSRKGICACA